MRMTGRSLISPHICMARIGLVASTTRRSVRFRTPASGFRYRRHHCSARAGFTKPIGCCAIMVSASMSCCRAKVLILRWMSIQSLRGRLRIPNFSRWTSIARHAKRCFVFQDLDAEPSIASFARGDFESIRSDDLKRLGVPAAKAKPFIVLPDFRPRDDAIAAMRSRTAARGLPEYFATRSAGLVMQVAAGERDRFRRLAPASPLAGSACDSCQRRALAHQWRDIFAGRSLVQTVDTSVERKRCDE